MLSLILSIFTFINISQDRILVFVSLPKPQCQALNILRPDSYAFDEHVEVKYCNIVGKIFQIPV